MPVHGKTKKEVLSEFRRNELLVAARAIFSKKGFHDATIDEIAEAAEVAKGTVYLYYKSKRDLYLEALRYGIESLNRELNLKAAEAGAFREKLRILTATKMDFFEENREFFNIYYSELGKPPSHPAGLFHLATFGFRGSNPNEEAFKHRREAAFDQFDNEWDAKEKVLERQIDALEDQKDRSDGWRKEQLRAELKRFEQLKDDFEIRRDAAKETLKRQWGD